jgi:alkyl hydroperoxide reductase subunit AhpC
MEWIKDIEEVQNVTLQYPIIADESKEVANLYDMIHPNANETLTVRSVFIIGPDKR